MKIIKKDFHLDGFILMIFYEDFSVFNYSYYIGPLYEGADDNFTIPEFAKVFYFVLSLFIIGW